MKHELAHPITHMFSLPLLLLALSSFASPAQTPQPSQNQFFQFKVGDLVISPPPPPPVRPAPAHPDYGLEGLASLIRRGIRPALSTTQGSLHFIEPEYLVLVGSAEQGEWVRDFLALQREPGHSLLFEIRMLRAPRGAFEAFGLGSAAGDGSAESGSERPVIFTDPEAYLAMVKQCKHSPDVETLQDMKVVSLLGQRATISAINKIAFVSGYEEVLVEPGDQLLLDPQVSEIEEGNRAEVLGVLLDPRRVSVQVHLLRSEVERPLQVRPGPLPQAAEGRTLPPVVSPVLHSAELKSSMELPSHGAAVWISHDVDDDHDLAFLLQVTAEHVPQRPQK